MTVDIPRLQYFCTVYECLNYTKAAQLLYVSRQTLQQAVRCLERDFGNPLFTVAAGGLAPTEQGTVLYREAQKVLASYEELRLAMASPAREEPRPMRQGTITNIHDVMSEKEAQECHRRHFDPRDTHISSSSDALREMVRRGELDVAYLYGDEVLSDGFIKIVTEPKKPLWLAVPAGHRLASRASVCVEDLRGEPLLSMGQDYDIDKTLAACCEARGFSPLVVCVSPSSDALLAKTAMGAGVTYRLTGLSPTPRVVCLPFEDAELYWDNYAIFRDGPLDENPGYERFRSAGAARG